MEELPPISSTSISQADWEQTPANVKQLVETLSQRLTQLEVEVQQLRAENQQLSAENQLLREQINRTSANSSQPPSQDPPQGFKPSRREKSGKKRGGQSGHEGHGRTLYPIEQCQSVTDHYPSGCWRCGSELTGQDANPMRYQIVEIPPITPDITEHRFHALTCTCCGVRTRAYDRAIVDGSGYGERVVAHVALLSSLYRQSHRMVQQLMQELFGMDLALLLCESTAARGE